MPTKNHKPRIARYVVSMPLPRGVNHDDGKHYVEDAVKSWSGQFRPPHAYDDPNDPGDPLWGIGDVTTVKHLRPSTKR